MMAHVETWKFFLGGGLGFITGFGVIVGAFFASFLWRIFMRDD